MEMFCLLPNLISHSYHFSCENAYSLVNKNLSFRKPLISNVKILNFTRSELINMRNAPVTHILHVKKTCKFYVKVIPPAGSKFSCELRSEGSTAWLVVYKMAFEVNTSVNQSNPVPLTIGNQADKLLHRGGNRTRDLSISQQLYFPSGTSLLPCSS